MTDIQMIIYALMAAATAAVISFLSTPLVKTFAERVGAMDVPKDARRIHKVPIPRMGGLAIFLAFIFSTLLFVEIDNEVRGILLGSVIIVVLGAIDDRIPLRAGIKFVVQILAALVAVLHGVIIQTISNPNIFSDQPYLNLGVLAIPITILWIVAITNSVNLIDGLDGLAVGVSAISSGTMLIIAILVSDSTYAIMMAALVGACVGFIPYNFNPAKIFMGDTGATFLGFILATVSVQGLFKFYAIISFTVPFLMLAIPIFDTVFAFLRRLLTGKNPMSADRGHVHHRLIDMGFSQKQSVAILYVISAIFGLAAVVLTSSGEIKAMILLAAVFVAGILATSLLKGKNIFGNSNQQGTEAEPEAEPEAKQELPSEVEDNKNEED